MKKLNLPLDKPLDPSRLYHKIGSQQTLNLDEHSFSNEYVDQLLREIIKSQLE